MNGGGLLAGLWAASLSAAVIILAVLPLRALFRDRTPRRVFCLLWDVALIRLLIPGPLPSPVSVWQWLPERPLVSTSGVSRAAAPGPAVQIGGAVTEGAAALPGAAAVSNAAASLDTGAILAAVWLTVTLALAVGFLWSHLRFRRLYADSLPCGDVFVRGWLAARRLRRRVQVRTSDRIAAPLTYGVLHPVVLLPVEMDWAVLPFVLEHEVQHIRRFDTLRKGLLAAALCLHWFNPLVWVLYVLSNRDMELACDEAVTERGADRAAYAQSLLSMEERRGRWGLTGSHFSQNALEERIKAIMKHKHTSIAALVAVLAVMSITVAAFAANPPDKKTVGTPSQNIPQNSSVNDHLQPVEDDVMILSKGGEDGEKLYSADSGKTWLSEERYHAQYGSWGDDWQVEWWTAEDYAAWLEEEKQALQSIIGERGYTGSEGWFTWDQKRVDETIALYENILEEIKNGALYSKTITDKNGNVVEDVALGSGALDESAIFTFNEKDAVTPKDVDEAALSEELKAFGIGGSKNLMTYKGQLIRTLVDGVPVGDSGYSIQYVYSNPNGVVDVHTLRSVIQNADGSNNPMGKLIGVAAEGDTNFDRGLIESAAFSGGIQAATAEGNGGEGGTTFEEIFARYQSYGLVYTPRESGMGSLTWNGQTVKSFADVKPDGGAFSYQDPYVEAGLKVVTDYDAQGTLTGLRAE